MTSSVSLRKVENRMADSKQYLLQIVICTYNRTEAAARAIRSCLPIISEEVGIVVHSNSPDPKLHRVMADHGLDHFYGYHDHNKGGLENFRSAAKLANSKYLLCLSDEDEVIPEGISNLVSALKADPSQTYFILSQISDYFTVRDFGRKAFSRKQALTRFSWVLTYVSGFTFPSSIVVDDHFDQYFKECSYTHLIYKMMMKESDRLLIPSVPFITKNEDVKEGGHAFEHIEKGHVEDCHQTLKNPAVYGYSARILQFYNLAFLQSQFGLSGWRRVIVLVELAIIWSNAYHQANKVTTDTEVQKEASKSAHYQAEAKWPTPKVAAIFFRLLCSQTLHRLGITRGLSLMFKLIRASFGIKWG